LTDNHKIQAIIFDLGRVLIDFDHTIAAKRIAKFTDQTVPEIFNFFFDSKLTGLFEEDKITPLEFFSEVRSALNLRLDYQAFVPIWNEIFFLSEENLAVYQLAKSLRAKYKIMLLSNTNILHFEYLKKSFPVFDVFHHIITSFEVGFQKPHPLIYKKALTVLETPAEEVFYTDDRSELVEAARNLRIRGFVFRGVEQLKKDLMGAGVNIN